MIKNSKTILELLEIKTMKTRSKNLNDVPAFTGAFEQDFCYPPPLVISCVCVGGGGGTCNEVRYRSHHRC